MSGWASDLRADGSPDVDALAAPDAGNADRVLSGWWSRVLAALLDGLVLLIPLIIIAIALHQYHVTHFITSDGTVGTTVTSRDTWVDAVVWFLYAAILLTRRSRRNGQTLGKQGLQIRVVRNDGRPVDLWKVVIREGVGKGLPVLALAAAPTIGALAALGALIAILDYLWPLWDPENRALHDLLAGTHVIRVPQFAGAPSGGASHASFGPEPPGAAPPAAPGPDAAIRARLNAIVLDEVIVALATGLILSVTGRPARSADALVLTLTLQFLYFFPFEAVRGQTIGKRVFHIRVVGLGGEPATVRQAAIRNVLRFADAFPFLYASGLLSLMRSGRQRRQRIGDIAAGTIVVSDQLGKPLVTPRWLLPAATLVATGLSVAILVVVIDAPSRQSVPVATGFTTNTGSPPVPVLTGFTGNTSQPPAPGAWEAIGTTTSSTGYANSPVGGRIERSWTISRTCSATGQCEFVLTRSLADGPPLTATLILESDGWHATFPLRPYTCGENAGQIVYWQQHSDMVLRFTAAGTAAEANEVNFSYTPQCGYGTSTTTWSATSQDTQADDPAIALAQEAQVAAATYASNHQASYVALTPAALNSIDSSLQIVPGDERPYVSGVTATRFAYTLTVTSTSGDTFSITREGPRVTRTCTPPSGVNGDCNNGTW